MIRSVNDIDFSGKRALIRVDFNVPLSKTDFSVSDDTRMVEALPTLNKILNDGGSIVLMSHLGRPKEGPEEKYSLKHIVKHLSKLLNREVLFADDCIGDEAFKMSSNLKSGSVLLLENLRFYKDEEKGSVEFAKKLSTHGDIYVNDAFGTAHRAHASTAVIAQFFPGKKCFGLLMKGEIESISKVIKHPEKPFTAILGGAKVSDKLAVIKNLMDKTDNILIGGGMTFTFVKAQGGKIGNSLCEDDMIDTCLDLLKTSKERGVNIVIPTDVKINNQFANEGEISFSSISQIHDGFMGLDIGPESIKMFSDVISKSKTILWNGPMGVFEMSNFEEGTEAIGLAVADATKNGAYSLVGGGDSVAAVNKYGLKEQVSYVSTGGGAMLEFIEGIELPGIKAMNE